LSTVARYLEWVVPGQSLALIGELAAFLRDGGNFGWLLLVTMLFFSSLAFTVLENAMSVIFVHRVAIRRRHFLVSAVLPYCYIAVLSLGLLIVTVVSGRLLAIGGRHVDLLGHEWSLDRLSTGLLYLLGFFGEILMLTSIYMVMPVGRLSLRRALCGAVLAAVLWEISRHVLVWYFTSLSQVSRVYGSLTTAIVVLLGLEIAATLLLLGAQVIAELERGDWKEPTSPQGNAETFRT
jgi:YihY family inner membrane protein